MKRWGRLRKCKENAADQTSVQAGRHRWEQVAGVPVRTVAIRGKRQFLQENRGISLPRSARKCVLTREIRPPAFFGVIFGGTGPVATAIDKRLEFPSISATLSRVRQESSAAEYPGQFRAFYVTIFQKIIDRKIPASIVHEDEHCIAFHDVNPQAPVHVLLIPRKPLVSLNDLTDSDAQLAGHLLRMVPRVAAMLGLTEGYRTVINTGDHGGQSVFHLHIHILGGRPLGWPPG